MRSSFKSRLEKISAIKRKGRGGLLMKWKGFTPAQYQIVERATGIIITMILFCNRLMF